MPKNDTSPKRPDIGGQAVLEGVMMKSPDSVAIAVRKPDGSICVKCDPYVSPTKKHKWMGWPIVRGAVNMVNMLVMGMNTLEASSQMLGVEEEEPTKFEKWLAKKFGKSVDKIVMGVAIVLAVFLSVGLFMVIPSIAATLINKVVKSLLLVNLCAGAVRILILIGYIWACGRIPDMRRTFEYHGAEHKTVYCHEAGLELTPANAKQFSTLHPRCGTSFLFVVMIISILVFSIATPILRPITPQVDSALLNAVIRVVLKLLLLPIVVSLSYEFNRLVGRHDNWLTRVLSAPGMWLQYLTTNEPDDSMIEVGIKALTLVLPEEEGTDKW